jgi:hypothetical protein
MTDQQHPTICPRCGGLRDRCECAEIRREAFAEAAEVCSARAESIRVMAYFHGSSWSEGVGAAEDCAEDLRDLARKPGAL